MLNRKSLFATFVLSLTLLLVPTISGAQERSEDGFTASNPTIISGTRPIRTERPSNAVPEPGAALLFAAGLVTLSAAKRRRKED